MRLPFRRRVDAAAELAAGRALEEEVARSVPFDQRGAPLGRAVAHYLAAADRSPPRSSLWIEAAFSAGCLLAGENSVRDLDRAVELLEAVVASVEGYHPAYYFLGEALVMRKDFDGAEKVWRSGLALDPGQRPIVDVLRYLPIDRVHEAAKRGDHSSVVAAVERIPERDRSAEAWLLAGDALAALGRHKEASAAWRRAMALEPLKGMRKRFSSIGEPLPAND